MTWAESQSIASLRSAAVTLDPDQNRRTIAAVWHDPAGNDAERRKVVVDLKASFGGQRVISHPILGDLPPARQVAFTFDGEAVTGREGETLLPALLASGVRVLRTTPDLGDPRGGYCLIGRCSDCQVIVDGAPSNRACLTLVRDGMVVRTQHGLGTDIWSTAGDEL